VRRILEYSREDFPDEWEFLLDQLEEFAEGHEGIDLIVSPDEESCLLVLPEDAYNRLMRLT